MLASDQPIVKPSGERYGLRLGSGPALILQMFMPSLLQANWFADPSVGGNGAI